VPALSVNIDHVATVRQARYRNGREYGEPDPVRAAHEAELGGADGITVHLREDRRHIVDRDVELLRPLVRVRFNLEMAATDEMVAIAVRLKPHTAMLVPEGRNEVTTEGGLDVASQPGRMKDVVNAWCRRLLMPRSGRLRPRPRLASTSARFTPARMQPNTWRRVGT